MNAKINLINVLTECKKEKVKIINSLTSEVELQNKNYDDLKEEVTSKKTMIEELRKESEQRRLLFLELFKNLEFKVFNPVCPEYILCGKKLSLEEMPQHFDECDNLRQCSGSI